MAGTTRIVLCQCARAHVISSEATDQVRQRLNPSGVAFDLVEDLCELAARKDPALKRMAESNDLRIAACFPRAVTWLFHAAGADLQKEQVALLNLREQNAEDVTGELLRGVEAVTASRKSRKPELISLGIGNAAVINRDNESKPCQCSCNSGAAEKLGAEPVKLPVQQPKAWMPWFPVIDYDRCEGCKQCLGFCLFGVFAVGDDGRVEVRKPQNCKTGCPACGRVCPEVAIMFPKYDKRPINGDVVNDNDVKGDTVKVELSSLVGGDVRTKLRQRRQATKQRFAVGPKIPNNPEERAAHLKKMQAELDIPESVIQDLSSSCGCQKATEDTGDSVSGLPPCCSPSTERPAASPELT